MTDFAGGGPSSYEFSSNLAARAALDRAAYLGDGGDSVRRFAVIRKAPGVHGGLSAIPERYESVEQAELAIRAIGGAGVVDADGAADAWGNYVFDVGQPINVVGPGPQTEAILSLFTRQ